MAMGNSKGIVKRLEVETIDAAKYLNYKLLFIERYEFNDYPKAKRPNKKMFSE